MLWTREPTYTTIAMKNNELTTFILVELDPSRKLSRTGNEGSIGKMAFIANITPRHTKTNIIGDA